MCVLKGRYIALDYLQDDYNIDRSTSELKQRLPSKSNQPTIDEYPAQRSLELNRNFESFKQLLIRWIVCCHIAFFQFKNEYFRQLLNFLYPGLKRLLPKAANTIRGWVVQEYKNRKAQLRRELKEARSAISISFDLWTSPNAHAVLGVVAYFINKRGRRRQAVLGL
jgi:hypothetical protein